MPPTDKHECTNQSCPDELHKTSPQIRTPDEWSEIDGLRVADPDGWRGKFRMYDLEYPAQGWEVPIGRTEWEHRLAVSSVIRKAKPKTTAVQKWADEAMFPSEPLDATSGPQVHLLYMNSDPLGSIAAAALMYKGIVVRDLADVTDQQRREMFEQIQQTKLKAPFEFVNVHFMVEGVTRSLTHQMVRARTAVFAQESLRFAVVEDNFAERVALPPSLAGSRSPEDIQVDVDLGGYDRLSDVDKARWQWERALHVVEGAYDQLVNHGVPAEDARGLLPHNITTRLNYATNLRALQDHAGNRLCTQAQFEWRALWIKLVQAIREYGSSRWYYRPGPVLGGVPTRESFSSAWQFDLIADMFRPVCYLTGKCEFAAQDLDRKCSIRGRVDANARNGRPSSEWHHDTPGGKGEEYIEPIHPREWLADPGAAR